MKRVCIFIVMLILALSINASDIFHSELVKQKIGGITKIIALTNSQRNAIVDAYEALLVDCDSTNMSSLDVDATVEALYQAKRKFHEKVMSVLTDLQITKYVQIAFAPEIKAKTEYKVSLLKEQNQYSSSELEDMRVKIYNYLMLEKVVYFRDKYDFAKQKNNISRLKKIQPNCLKESNNLEKQKGLGKFIQGKIKWN